MVFPETCPICEAPIAKVQPEQEATRYFKNGPVYECGGQYTIKPQIQNHTQKWWGTCPRVYQENLEALRILDADVTVWIVRKSGKRTIVAGFQITDAAEAFGKSYSKDYPRRIENVDYVEVVGNLGFTRGYRYRMGKVIARKERGRKWGDNEVAWRKVEDLGGGSFRVGDKIED